MSVDEVGRNAPPRGRHYPHQGVARRAAALVVDRGPRGLKYYGVQIVSHTVAQL